jgi:hypothetical protein
MKGGTNMKTKKSQQEIIVTVLLVLIAIAAVILIANFVINMVKDKAAAGEGQVDCLNVAFTINRAINSQNNITVTRDAGGDDIEVIGTKVLVNGEVKNATGVAFNTTLETKEIIVSGLVTGAKVQVAPVLKGGVTCDPRGEKIVTAA